MILRCEFGVVSGVRVWKPVSAEASALVPPEPRSSDELDWLSSVRTRFNREDIAARV